MAYDNELKGALFKNTKATGEKHPPYTGSIQIDGITYNLSAWVNESPKAGKYFSIKAEKRTNKNQQNKNEPEDDLPF